MVQLAHEIIQQDIIEHQKYEEKFFDNNYNYSIDTYDQKIKKDVMKYKNLR